MKEKNKKILKGLGVVTLACVGMVGLTGCSIDLTQEQVDKIMYTVDNSDKFMQDTLNLLEKQNNQLDRDEAYALCKLAYNKIFLNYEGLRDNLMITIEDDTMKQTMMSYSIDGNDVIVSVLSQEPYNATIVLYEDGENNYYYADEDGEIFKEQTTENIHYLNNWYSFDLINRLGLTKDDITSCEELENGNYKIQFSANIVETEKEEGEEGEEEITSYVWRDLILDIEITKTGEYVTMKSHSSYQDYVSKEFYQGSGTMTFSYGNVDEEYVNELLAEAKQAEITPQE